MGRRQAVPSEHAARCSRARFDRITQCRRVATRYDRRAANYLAFIKFASIRIRRRANASAP
jgi:transposase